MPLGFALGQVAAHRHALAVADRRRQTVLGVLRGEVPAAEEAHQHARAGGAVGLLVLHRVEQGRAGVLAGPHRGEAGGDHPPTGVLGVADLGHRVLDTLGVRFRAGVLAEEVVLLCGGETGVAVGRADEAELVRVHAELLLELHADPQRRASVLVLEHLVRLELAEVQVALVPDLVVGELVVRRQERVGLAVSLDLGDLVERLPLDAFLRPRAVVGFAGERIRHREHDTVAEVAVVRDRQDPPAGLVLVGLQPLPQVALVRATVRRQRGVRLHDARLARPVAVDDNAVSVGALLGRGPLVAVERGVAAGLVVLLRCRDGLLPGRAVGGGPGGEVKGLRETVPGERLDDLDRGRDALLATRLDHVVPLPAGRVGEHLRVAGVQEGEEPHVVRVVGDDEEVERARQLDLQAGRRSQLLAARKAMRILGQEPRTECAGVHRIAGVQMGVAPERIPNNNITAIIE